MAFKHFAEAVSTQGRGIGRVGMTQAVVAASHNVFAASRQLAAAVGGFARFGLSFPDATPFRALNWDRTVTEYNVGGTGIPPFTVRPPSRIAHAKPHSGTS
jgi:hypothetical protein